MAAVNGFCRTCYSAEYGRAKTPTRAGPVSLFTAEDIAHIKRMRAQFRTLREIAGHYGCSIRTIQAALRPDYTPKVES
jgi:hypothetical protein